MIENLIDHIYVDSIDNFEDAVFSSFDCGREGLNNVLKDELHKYSENMELHTKIIMNSEKNEIIGYYSLKNSSLLVNLFADKKKRGIPALELSYFAIDRKYQRQGIGSWILKAIISNSREYSREFSGCKMIVLSAVSECLKFYEGNKFTTLLENFSLIHDDCRKTTIPMFINLLNEK